MRKFVVTFRGVPIVIINAAFITGTDLLNWYAEKYDFDRSKLSGEWCQEIIKGNE